MTNEDAIRILEAYKQRLVNSVTIGLDKDIEAYEMAIKVLEQTDGDLISRASAEQCCLNGWNKDYKEILEDIRKLQTITAEPTTAESEEEE